MSILNIVFIVFDIIIMFWIWKQGINVGAKFIVYVLLAVYCKWEFNKSVLTTISKLIIGVMVSALFQLLGGVIGSYFSEYIQKDIILMLMINAFALVLAVVVFEISWKRRQQQKEDVRAYYLNIKSTIVLCGITTLLLIMDYHYKGKVKMVYYIVYLGLCAYMLFRHRESEMAKREYEKQLQEKEVEKAYEEVYDTLLQDIRKRQHDFNNQLSVLYGMHVTATSLEELILNQSEYGSIITSQRRYDNIPSLCNNKTLAAYLYQECCKLERIGITVHYEISISDGKSLLKTYEIIEILGALISNAVENSEYNCDNKIIMLKAIEYEDKIVFQIANCAKYITSQEFEKMCSYGYSTKGERRGIGLARVKEMCEKADSHLLLENVKKDNLNWVNISVIVPKKKR